MASTRNSKGGRPKLPPGHKRNVAIAALLTESERERVDRYVAEQNVDLSSFLRGLILEKIRETKTETA